MKQKIWGFFFTCTVYISEQTNAKLTKQIHITHNCLTVNSSDDVIYVIAEKKTLGISVELEKPGSIIETNLILPVPRI